MLRLKLLSLLALLVLPIVAVAQAQITFQDGTFLLSNWEVIQDNSPNGAYVGYGRVTTGGNPGSCMEITLYSGRDFNHTRGYFFRRDAVFNPSTQGEVQSLSYSEDNLGLGSGSMGFCLALKQNGNVYLCTQSSGLGNGGTTSSITTWSRHSSTGILARNFALALAATPGADRFPDFSETGSPITFGFARTYSYLLGYTIGNVIDNWRVVVNFIPVITATGNVGGFIILQGIVASAPQQTITFTLNSTGENPTTYNYAVPVSPNGVYQINDIPVGTYSMCIKGDKYLSRMVPVTVIGSSTATLNISLKTGDANNDDFVDIRDLLILIAAYNQASPNPGYNSAADFTLDGVVDIADLLLLIGNFNEQGECP